MAISDIVSNKEVPFEVQQNKQLWSGCISGAWSESNFIESFKSIGFKDIKLVDRQKKPWRTINDIEFRSITLTGTLKKI